MRPTPVAGDRLIARRVSTHKKTNPSAVAAFKAVVAAGVSWQWKMSDPP